MTQTILIQSGKLEVPISLPDPEEKVVANVRWGRADHLFTPAFWYVRVEYAKLRGDYATHRLGRSLAEEVVACLLGGFGMPAELGIQAFRTLLGAGIVEKGATEEEIRTLLMKPLVVNGRLMRYRYPAQKARFVSIALSRLKQDSPPESSARDFRDWLMSFEGIGPKTASWITRNHLNSDEVAILDIHILRAGRLCGLFDSEEINGQSYFNFERKLVSLASAMGIRLSLLDAVIWAEMREIGWLSRSRPTAARTGKSTQATLQQDQGKFSSNGSKFLLTSN